MVLSVKMALRQRSRGNEENPTYSESSGADYDVGAAKGRVTVTLLADDVKKKRAILVADKF
jgi:hypothetical protein